MAVKTICKCKKAKGIKGFPLCPVPRNLTLRQLFASLVGKGGMAAGNFFVKSGKKVRTLQGEIIQVKNTFFVIDSAGKKIKVLFRNLLRVESEIEIPPINSVGVVRTSTSRGDFTGYNILTGKDFVQVFIIDVEDEPEFVVTSRLIFRKNQIDSISCFKLKPAKCIVKRKNKRN